MTGAMHSAPSCRNVPADDNGFIQYEMDHGGVRWIVLDTLDAGRHGGMICEMRAAWLKKRLGERKDVPTIIILHHPPVDTGIDWMSALSCEAWVQRLEAVDPAREAGRWHDRRPRPSADRDQLRRQAADGLQPRPRPGWRSTWKISIPATPTGAR